MSDSVNSSIITLSFIKISEESASLSSMNFFSFTGDFLNAPSSKDLFLPGDKQTPLMTSESV